jgi:hypothetical protein
VHKALAITTSEPLDLFDCFFSYAPKKPNRMPPLLALFYFRALTYWSEEQKLNQLKPAFPLECLELNPTTRLPS